MYKNRIPFEKKKALVRKTTTVTTCKAETEKHVVGVM